MQCGFSSFSVMTLVGGVIYDAVFRDDFIALAVADAACCISLMQTALRQRFRLGFLRALVAAGGCLNKADWQGHSGFSGKSSGG